MFLDSFTKSCTRAMWSNGNGCLETHTDLPHWLGVKGSICAASSCRVTKEHITCRGINVWEGNVAAASLSSRFSLTFLQGQFVAGSWLAELLWPCCVSNGNITYPCRETSPARQRAQHCLLASKHQKLPGFKTGISISLTGSELTDWKINTSLLGAW